MSRPARRTCDECGHAMDKACRVEQDHAYCQTCYARVFKQAICTRCGNPARFHKNDSQPVCRPCRRAERTCLRCGRPVPRAHKTVGRRVLCHACASVFTAVVERRGDETSSAVGEFSTAVSGPGEAPSRPEHATCAVCRRHRPVAAIDDKRRPVCRDCVPGREVSHSCPDCGRCVPGGGQARCRTCAIELGLTRRIRLNLELLEQDWCRDMFLAFCEWERLDRGANNITSRINRYAVFFERLDRNFERPDLIDQDGLLQAFSPEALRRGFLPVQFLVERLQIPWHSSTTARAAEVRRINQILESFSDDDRRKVMADYCRYLGEAPNGRALSHRTIRGYMRASAKLLESTGTGSFAQLKQRDVDRFVRQNPGYRASITPFLAYVRERHDRSVRVAGHRKSSHHSVDRLQSEVRLITEGLATEPNEKRARALIARLLSLLYQIPLEQVVNMRRTDLARTTSGTGLKTDEGVISLEPYMRAMVDRYLLSGDGVRVFPGRNEMQGLSTSTVWYHVKSLRDAVATEVGNTDSEGGR